MPPLPQPSLRFDFHFENPMMFPSPAISPLPEMGWMQAPPPVVSPSVSGGSDMTPRGNQGYPPAPSAVFTPTASQSGGITNNQLLMTLQRQM